MDAVPFNGIDATTGAYITQATPEELVDWALAASEAADAQALKDALRRYQVNSQPHLRVEYGVDVTNLAETGWGIIFAKDDPQAPAIRDALAPLLTQRRQRAGDLYREYSGDDGYQAGESKLYFLARHDVDITGPVKPGAMPYYLLLVGSPEVIPFTFQYQLDIQYAVGRVHFGTLEEYAAYAEGVVSAETTPTFAHPRRAAFFSVANPNDQATHLSHQHLVEPLATNLQTYPDWRVDLISPEAALKPRLGQLLGGDDAPAFLFTASHGVRFPDGDPRQVEQQGALLCGEWPGPYPPQALSPDWYFSAEDLAADAHLNGLVAFHFACFSAGTPCENDFDHLQDNMPGVLAARPFVARLPQRLLAGGALAVIGHVERAWPHAYLWPGGGRQLQVFQEALRKLLDGAPVGFVMEGFNERYAEIAAELTSALQPYKLLVRSGLEPPLAEKVRLGGLWTSQNDARSYVILGDPAVRLRPAPVESVTPPALLASGAGAQPDAPLPPGG